MLGAAFLALAGCANDNRGTRTDASATTDGPSVEADLAVPADLVPAPQGDLVMTSDSAESPVDMSRRPDLPALESCFAVHECILNCMPGTIQVCGPACAARATVNAMKWSGPLLQCIAPKCFNGGACADPLDALCSICFNTNCFKELMDCFSNG